MAIAPDDQAKQNSKDEHAHDHVAEGLIGPEPAFALGIRGRRHAVTTKHVEVGDDQGDDQRRQDCHMQGVETRQRVMSINRAADNDLLHERPQHRQVAGDVGCHLRRPVALLVPGKQVAGQA